VEPLLLPGVALALLFGLFWPYVGDVLDWPLLPIDEVSVDELLPLVPGVAELPVDPEVPVLEPVAT